MSKKKVGRAFVFDGSGSYAPSAIALLAAVPGNEGALREVEAAVAAASEAGHGPQGDNLIDWLAAGDFDGSETVASIAAEWDAGRE